MEIDVTTPSKVQQSFLVEDSLERAEAHLSAGLVLEAEELFVLGLESAQNARARLGVAKCAFYRRDLHEALAHLQMVAAEDPQCLDLANTTGAVLFGLGLIEDAEKEFRRAVQTEPDSAVGWRNLLELYSRLGEKESAIDAAQHLLALEPDASEALELLEAYPGRPPVGAPPAETCAARAQAPSTRPQAELDPELRAGAIEGVAVSPLVAHVDDRGYLVEILRSTDPTFTRFGQVYLVGDIKAGTTRAYHKHEALWDWFFISHGCAKFVLVDDRPSSPSYGVYQVVVAGERNPTLVTVPPGVFHGWMALADDTQLVSMASEVYNRENPDEVRVPPERFGDLFAVKGR
jgi:dTDP-4-dehydrorhamnose 3,5-epimerase